jgi:hypothetical protein
VIDYCQELGYPCPHNRNPADHFSNEALLIIYDQDVFSLYQYILNLLFFFFFEVQLCYVPKEIEKTDQFEGDEETQDDYRLTLRSSTPEQVQQLIAYWSERSSSFEAQQSETLRVFEGLKPVTEVKRVKKWVHC